MFVNKTMNIQRANKLFILESQLSKLAKLLFLYLYYFFC